MKFGEHVISVVISTFMFNIRRSNAHKKLLIEKGGRRGYEKYIRHRVIHFNLNLQIIYCDPDTSLNRIQN